MNSEATSDDFPKEIPPEMLRHIAEKVGEPKPIETHQHVQLANDVVGKSTAHLSESEHTYTRIVCNLLTLLWKVQRERLPHRKPCLKYQLLGARTERRITLVANYLAIMAQQDCDTLLRSEPRVLDLRFQFTSLLEDKHLTYGCLTIDISCTTPIDTPIAYCPPSQRRTRTKPVDWTRSIVLAGDRTMLLDLIDDVYNIDARMPTTIEQWLEPILGDGVPLHHHTQNGNGKRARGAGKRADSDDESDDDASTTETIGPLLGYCVSFTHVPSFNLSFLRHLEQKYSGRWLSAMVLFPHESKKPGRVREPQRLVISLRAETTLVQQAKADAMCSGAKRLRTIIEREFVDTK